MAWNTLHVFTYQEICTAANLNTNFANLNETSPAKVTTKGDMTAATGANALARVAAPGIQYWSPIYDSAQSMGSRFAPQPLILGNGYSSYTVVNTNAEIDTWSYTMPANTLPSKGVLRIDVVTLFKNNSGSTYGVINKLYLGASSISVASVAPTTGTVELFFRYTFWIRALNATNSQRMFGICDSFGQLALGNSNTAYVSHNNLATSEDTTASKVIKFSVTLGATHASLQQIVYDPVITLYPSMT